MNDFDKYQKEAYRTRKYLEPYKIIYPMIGMADEGSEAIEKFLEHLMHLFWLAISTGRAGGKVKKWLRRDNGQGIDLQAMIDEMGDALWCLSAMATDLGVDLSEVAQRNLEKLHDREMRGVIMGDGDNR